MSGIIGNTGSFGRRMADQAKFCVHCGQRMNLETTHCPSCGHPSPPPPAVPRIPPEGISDRKFGTAVALCGVFGIVGIHHFYLGNILHGLIDLLMFVVGFGLVLTDDSALAGVGVLIILVDVAHTVWVMIRLFTGKTRDGRGRLVVYPGQL